MKIARHWEPMLVVSSDSETESWWKNVPVLCNVHPRWKTDLQTKWSWRGEWHWRVPCQTCGSPTHQCPHSGTFRLLSGLPIFHQLPDSHMTFPKILLFRSTYWSAPRVPLIPRTSCALCRRASARRCRCCFWDTYCLQVTIYFRSGLALVLNRVYNYDRGPPHPNRAAASGRLQEVGLDSPCWQPGVESIQSAPFLSKFTPQKDNSVFVNRL